MEAFHRQQPPNPREKSNFLSILFFTWTIPLFKKGFKKDLQLDDIFQSLKCDKADSLGDRLEANWKEEAAKSKRSLAKAVLRTFWKEYALQTFFCGIADIFVRLGTPFFLGKFLAYFRTDSNKIYQDVVIYGCALLFVSAISAMLLNQNSLRAYHNGMKVRIAICSVIYRKSLRLSQSSLGQTSPGQVVNLLSNDVQHFDYVSIFINWMWTAPVLTLIVGIVLFNEVGIAGLIGIGIVFIIIPIQSYNGKLASKFRLQTAMRTDERVRFMDEIISGVQVIKMYAWEQPFAKLIAIARKFELKIITKFSYIRGLFMTFQLFTTRFALFGTMLSIALLDGPQEITAAKIFAITSYFNIISFAMGTMLVLGISEVAEVFVAFKRLQNFLELDERETKHLEETENGSSHLHENGKDTDTHKSKNTSNIAVSIKNGVARWVPATNIPVKKHSSKLNDQMTKQKNFKNIPIEPTLQGINIELPKGKLIGVIGSVGAGKSSFLQVLLRELPLESGSMRINGTISYASQESWLFAGSVRQNILFGQEYRRERYDAVVKMCALTKDFEQFENGDRTIVGDRGISLSGGQKARLNLARACYRNADIYLMDDPLSAVDAHVGNHIFNECMGPHSRLAEIKTTRVLVTHQVHFLKEADWLIVLNNGKIEVQGSPEDLSKSGVDFAKLVGTSEKDDHEIKSENIDQPMSRQLSIRSISSLNSSNESSIIEDDSYERSDEGIQMEASSKGKIKGSILKNYLASGANWFALIVLIFSFILVQALASATDYWVSIWTQQEEMRILKQNHSSSNEVNQSKSSYFSFTLSTDACIYIFTILISALFLFGITRSIGFFAVCIRASQNLHDAMFNGIISTSMRFFDINPSGRILNRFSKDIGGIDETLPRTMLDATQVILSIVGFVVVAITVNPYFILPLLVLGVLFAFVRIVFLRTMQNLKRLEGATKSPIFTHLSATLSGLPTIRAYNAEKILRNEFDSHQDTHSACWYMFVATSSAFGFNMEVLCFSFVCCIIVYYMIFGDSVSGSEVGLAVTQAMSLSWLQWGVRQSAEVSNQLTSVERVLEYRDLEPEKEPTKPNEVSTVWPSDGKIEFRNVFYRYSSDAEPVLRDLSFVIKPKEKIGIVGRTGAGKSSLIGTIFRLACIEGQILIDDIDTATIRLKDLRKRIAIIPQDPVLFSGTLRRNLDPFEEYPDHEIWSALEKVELKNIASGGLALNSAVSARGSNYSVGQRQLICLARAILRKNRILVLDEATANVDPQTDFLIQQTIREKFAECTVLTVAHRLHTIIDSDRILVMDTGRAAEFDEPHNLLQNESGIFYDMIKALGQHDFNRLREIARTKHNSMPSKTS